MNLKIVKIILVDWVILAIVIPIAVVDLAIKAYAFATSSATLKIKLATIAQKAWNLAQKANPIGLLVGLLVAAGVALWAYTKKTKKLGDETKTTKERLSENHSNNSE